MEKLAASAGSASVLWHKTVGFFFLYSTVSVEGSGENMAIGKLQD